MIALICWLNTSSDIILILLAIVLLCIIRKDPCFLKRPSLLITFACTTDLVCTVAMLVDVNPSHLGGAILYTIQGLSVFSDILVYWIIAYMYWVTSRNLAKKVRDKTIGNTEI